MSKENQPEAQPKPEGTTEDPKNAQPDPREEQIKTLTEKFDELSGKYEAVVSSNNAAQKNLGELQVKLKEKDIAAMDEADKVKAYAEEIKAAKEESEKIRAENALAHKRNVIDRLLDSADLPLEVFSDRINGESEVELRKDVEGLKKLIDDLVEKKAEARVNKILAGNPPQGGEPATGRVISQSEFNNLSPKEQAKFITGGGKIE